MSVDISQPLCVPGVGNPVHRTSCFLKEIEGYLSQEI